MANFLKKLRESNENVKRRWLIFTSAIMMIIVVFVWLNYFNTLVQQANTPPTADQAEHGLTFWQTFKSGLGIVSRGIAEKITSWFEILKSPKSYPVK